MKAILVIDMPIDCLECPFYDDMLMRCGYLKNEQYGVDARPSDCPLKPMPSFKAVDLNDTRDVVMFCHGWNTCLAEITGETE